MICAGVFAKGGRAASHEKALPLSALEGSWKVVSTTWGGDAADFDGVIYDVKIQKGSVSEGKGLATQFVVSMDSINGGFVSSISGDSPFCAQRYTDKPNSYSFYRGYMSLAFWHPNEYPCGEEEDAGDQDRDDKIPAVMISQSRYMVRLDLVSATRAHATMYYEGGAYVAAAEKNISALLIEMFGFKPENPKPKCANGMCYRGATSWTGIFEIELTKLSKSEVDKMRAVKSLLESAMDYELKGMTLEMVEPLKKALTLEPGNDDAAMKLVWVYGLMGKRKEATKTIKSYLATGGKRAEMYMELFTLHCLLQNPLEAEKAAIAAYKAAGPNDFDAANNLLFFYEGEKAYGKAERLARELIAGKRSLIAMYELALILMKKDKRNEKKALDLYTRANKDNQEEYPEAMAMLSVAKDLEMYWGDIQKSREYKARALEISPDCGDCHLSGFWRKTPDEAISMCEKALALQPSLAERALSCIADGYFRKSDYAKAVEYFEKTREANPDWMSYLYLRKDAAVAYFKAGQRDKVMALINDDATQLESNHTLNEQYDKALAKMDIFIEAGEYALAEEQFAEYVKRWPYLREGYALMADGYGRRGKCDKVRELLAGETQRPDEKAESFRIIGECHAAAGNYPAAEAELKRALDYTEKNIRLRSRKTPVKFEIWKSLGGMYEKQVKKDDAKKAYMKALEQFPYNWEVRKAVEGL